MVYTKYFENESSYNSYKNKVNHAVPLVSYIGGTDDVKIGECFYIIYNVTDIENPTDLGYGIDSAKAMYIDGKQVPVTRNYQFDTVGEHYAYVQLGALSQYCFRYAPIKSIRFPDHITEIPYRGFYGCGCEWLNTNNLTNITGGAGNGMTNEFLPNVTNIGSGAFSRGTIKNICGLDKLETVGSVAFEYCSAWENEVYLPSIKSLGYRSFYGCSSLKHVILGPNLTELGGQVFWFSRGLIDVTFLSVTPPTGVDQQTFEGCNNCLIYVPDESLETYKTTEGWSQFSSRIKPLSEKI